MYVSGGGTTGLPWVFVILIATGIVSSTISLLRDSPRSSSSAVHQASRTSKPEVAHTKEYRRLQYAVEVQKSTVSMSKATVDGLETKMRDGQHPELQKPLASAQQSYELYRSKLEAAEREFQAYQRSTNSP